MAGDWIKIEHATIDKPEVFQIAEQLGISPEQTFGHLTRIWVWADQQSRNGHDLNVTDSALDHVARMTGVASAMRSVGWLIDREGKTAIPNFERHNGQSAKTRALNGKVQKQRRGKSHPNVINLSRSNDDKIVTREEKKREEKKNSSPSENYGCDVLSDSDGAGFGEEKTDMSWAQPYYDVFIEVRGITSYKTSKYAKKPADFVRLADCVSGQGGMIELGDWRRACRNYFATPQSSHTLADLANRYETFVAHSLDRFNKPEGANGNNGRVVGGATPKAGKYEKYVER